MLKKKKKYEEFDEEDEEEEEDQTDEEEQEERSTKTDIPDIKPAKAQQQSSGEITKEEIDTLIEYHAIRTAELVNIRKRLQ